MSTIQEIRNPLFRAMFPSPMRIIPCVDSVSDNPVQLCAPAPIFKRHSFPQGSTKHSSTPNRESPVVIPHKRDDTVPWPLSSDSMTLFSRYAYQIPRGENPVWIIIPRCPPHLRIQRSVVPLLTLTRIRPCVDKVTSRLLLG